MQDGRKVFYATNDIERKEGTAAVLTQEDRADFVWMAWYWQGAIAQNTKATSPRRMGASRGLGNLR